ncbi:hypothetical protein KIN20_037198 [Parelaphostrongylus tenuis]|uniref:Uncharacterized protein n=1 Tax=Parelaphostrongylus tenuis TaxID=148309 RepID=A0AAD5WL46_PARTN|nr:hypothetical protein KIN20_037198 [Parelaphostrongylus tenuis]
MPIKQYDSCALVRLIGEKVRAINAELHWIAVGSRLRQTSWWKSIPNWSDETALFQQDSAKSRTIKKTKDKRLKSFTALKFLRTPPTILTLLHPIMASLHGCDNF